MKRITLSIALAATAFLIGPGLAQTPTNQDDQQLLTVIKDVQSQQARIAENEGKIDAKMTEILEVVRVARIFAGRGGK